MSEGKKQASGAADLAQRRAKLEGLRAAGWRYPNDFRPTHSCARLRAIAEEAATASGEPAPEIALEASVAGRLMAKRDMGSVLFLRLRDGSGQIQLFVAKKELREPSLAEAKQLDVGDILGADGGLFHTKTGELSIRVARLRLLSKSLSPLPDKYHGLSDTNLRYRRRYLDLIANPAVAETFERRSLMVSAIRAYLDGAGFLEVDTPMLQSMPGGAAARPFITHHNSLDLDIYLRVSPELYLKRLLVGGFDKVYELSRSFRNEGLSTRHNPEFTMLEFYESHQDYEGMMRHTQNIFAALGERLGRDSLRCGEEEARLDKDFERIRLEELIVRHHPGLGAAALRDPEALARYCTERLGQPEQAPAPDDAGAWLMHLYDSDIERRLIRPTFVTHHPASVSTLARVSDDDDFVCDRFELVINGQEICNGFSENNDPQRQREAFESQLADHALAEQLSLMLDEDYLLALEVGMPPAGGQGIGIDRLVMQLCDCPSIRDVILFPLTRPQREG